MQLVCAAVALLFEQERQRGRAFYLKSASRGSLQILAVRVVEGSWTGELVNPLLMFDNLQERFTLLPEAKGGVRHSWLLLDTCPVAGKGVKELFLDPTAAQLRHRVGAEAQCYKHVHVWSRGESQGAPYEHGVVVSSHSKLQSQVSTLVEDAAVIRSREPDRGLSYAY